MVIARLPFALAMPRHGTRSTGPCLYQTGFAGSGRAVERLSRVVVDFELSRLCLPRFCLNWCGLSLLDWDSVHSVWFDMIGSCRVAG